MYDCNFLKIITIYKEHNTKRSDQLGFFSYKVNTTLVKFIKPRISSCIDDIMVKIPMLRFEP